MSESVLISGASGFVGSNLADYLLENTDWDICLLVSPGSATEALERRVSVIPLDLTAELREIGRFDYMVNLASLASIPASVENPRKTVENNVAIGINMLEYARSHMPKAFIQFSTDEAFGYGGHEEWDVMVPGNPYAASKAAQEMVAISYWQSYGVPVVITNCTNIIGKRQDSAKLVPTLIRKIGAGGKVTLYTDSEGNIGRREYHCVRNVADAVLFILSEKPNSFPEQPRPDRYGIPGGVEMDNLEIARKIAGIMGKPLDYELVPAGSSRPGYSSLVPKPPKALAELGWVPRYGFPTELKNIIKNL